MLTRAPRRLPPTLRAALMSEQKNLVERFQRWVVAAIAFAALLYLAGSIWAGFDEVSAALSRFYWPYLIPMVALTLTNYLLRFVKWHYYLQRLDVPIPWGDDFWNFMAGLCMAISPAKAGEMLKPYVVRARVGTPMARTIPALVGERATDAVAMLALAGVSVTTYAADKTAYLVGPAVLILAAVGVVASKRLSELALGICDKLPVARRFTPKVREMLGATRVVVSPTSFVVTTLLSIVAWFAECIAFWLTFKGLGYETSIDLATFIYAFSTVAGAASPGGLGVADGAMAAGATTLMGVPESIAVGGALIARTVTLWLGVGIGAVCLFRVSAMLGGSIQLDEPGPDGEGG